MTFLAGSDVACAVIFFSSPVSPSDPELARAATWILEGKIRFLIAEQGLRVTARAKMGVQWKSVAFTETAKQPTPAAKVSHITDLPQLTPDHDKTKILPRRNTNPKVL